jgi:hypothetical protein
MRHQHVRNRTPGRSLSIYGRQERQSSSCRGENWRWKTAGCGARAAHWAFANIRDRREPFNVALQQFKLWLHQWIVRCTCRKSKALSQLASRAMDHPSEIHLAQTRRLIDQASEVLAHLQGSMLYTRLLIDASTQQIQEIQELLSRAAQIPNLQRDRDVLRSGMRGG